MITALQQPKHGPAFAAVDVVETEPLPAAHPLLNLNNLIVTPHVAGYSMAMYRDFWTLSADSIVAMAQGELPLSFVNPPVAAMFATKNSKM